MNVIAVIWHHWLSVAMVLGVVPLVIATVVGYLNKVIKPKYPTEN